nr:MAG TPA: Neck appendage protein [Caudoviricetes sp.]
MIYLLENNFPLNAAFDDEIIQEANSTYQLTFKFPTKDSKWTKLKNEVLLVADDLHGEQYFSIFEVEKQHGYITVYANQVATLLNSYSVNTISVDRGNGFTVMNALVSAFKRPSPFTFFSDINSKHTINLKNVSVMEALVKDKHSIVGQWGGDLVRDKYSIRLLERAGVENESLFAYKKNMKPYQESSSTKELKTRIHFRRVIESHDEHKKDQVFTATIDSPLIGKYKNIYEADMEVQDQDVVDQKTLEEYGKRYFRETLCDMVEESLEIDVIGQADQPVNLFDTVSVLHEQYNVDLRKKITKYRFAPMRKKLVSIGFGKVSQSFGSALGSLVENKVNERLDEKLSGRDKEYEAKVQRLVDNANSEYLKKATALEQEITDGIEQAKAQAEVVKEQISAQVAEKINAASQKAKNEITQEFNAKYGDITVKMEGLKSTTDQLQTSNVDIKKLINDFKDQTQSQFSGIQGAQSRFEQTTEKAISDLTNVTNGKADRSYVEQTVAGVKEEFTTLKVGSRNYAEDYEFTRGLWFFTHGDSSNSTGTSENGVYTISGSTNTWKQAQLFSSTAPSWATSKTTALDYLEKGEPYTLSFYAKRNSGSGTMWASLRENRKSGGNPERIYAQFQLTDEWQLYKVSVPALEKSDEFDFWRIIIGYSEAGSISFKKVELTQSTTRTDAGPAPEDQNYLVEQAQATFERTVEGLSTQLTKLETKTGPNGELEQRMQTYSEKAAVDAVKATRQILGQGYIAKSKYDEDVAGITRRLEDLKQNNDQVISSKIAEYKQTVDGQFTTIANQIGDMLRKTDIQITSGQISFGTGKTINGRTISSLLVQEPESIALIAQLIKVKGDMVVDGSIASRHLASQSVRTGHMESGSVTTQILASNAVTADKLLVDSAMINKLVTNKAFIKELIAQKTFTTELDAIKIAAERIQGGRLSANNGSTVFNLDDGTLNLYSNTGTIRRIDDTSSSQFIKLTKSGFIAEQFRDSNAALMVIGTNHNKNPKEVERHDNDTFAGIRLWSGKGSGKEESLTEFVGDRVLIYNNGRYRSPWNFHGNTNDGNAYLIPMNQNNVKHYIGRGDFFVEGIYSRHFYMSGGRDIGQYLWDLLTCFGVMKRHGQISGAAGGHVQGVLDKYGFR